MGGRLVRACVRVPRAMSMRRAKRGLTWIEAPFIDNGRSGIELLQPLSVAQHDLPLAGLREPEHALVAEMR